MSRIIERAREALMRGDRGSRGPEPRGEYSAMVACARIDPSLVIEMHALTGCVPVDGRFIERVRDALRLAANGATDEQLATSVRNMLIAQRAA